MRKYLEANYHCKIWQDRRGYHIEFDGVEVKVCKYMSEVEDYLKETRGGINEYYVKRSKKDY